MRWTIGLDREAWPSAGCPAEGATTNSTWDLAEPLIWGILFRLP
ncbi:hypothetical protein MYBA111488_03260 [Mycobacterium basiliense]